VKVGEIYWVDLPTRGGHAQSGKRPAIIFQTVTTLPTVLIIPLTSQVDALRFPGTALVEADKQNNLRHNSVALVFQLTAIDKTFLVGNLGNTSKKVMTEIYQTLDTITGRPHKL
jgi:mRNA-degrading endonuclease toxin of MazEF toxin-antitoxin module